MKKVVDDNMMSQEIPATDIERQMKIQVSIKSASKKDYTGIMRVLSLTQSNA